MKFKVTITATVDTENEEDMNALGLDPDDYTAEQIKTAVQENIDLPFDEDQTKMEVDAQ